MHIRKLFCIFSQKRPYEARKEGIDDPQEHPGEGGVGGAEKDDCPCATDTGFRHGDVGREGDEQIIDEQMENGKRKKANGP